MRRRLPTLDMFDPKNGFNPDGPSQYSAEFQARYFKAQADRMNRLIDIARDKLDRIKRNAYPYPDDDIMIIPRGGNPGAGAGADARLFVTRARHRGDQQHVAARQAAAQ